MWRRSLAGCLAIALSLAPCSAWSEPSRPAPSVTLSAAEYAQVEAAIAEARAALERSSETIAAQSKTLTRLSILCAALGVALVAEGVASAVWAIKN